MSDVRWHSEWFVPYPPPERRQLPLQHEFDWNFLQGINLSEAGWQNKWAYPERHFQRQPQFIGTQAPPVFEILPDPPIVSAYQNEWVIAPRPIPSLDIGGFDLASEPILPLPPLSWDSPLQQPSRELWTRTALSRFYNGPVGSAPIIFAQPLQGDSLRVHLTGAGADGGVQTDPDLSLGGFRSSTEAERAGIRFLQGAAGLSVLLASGQNIGSNGSVQIGTADQIAYAVDSFGTAKVLANGDTLTFDDGTDPSRFLRITRTSATDLSGAIRIEVVDVFENVFALANADNTESTGGSDKYRAIMFRNQTQATISGVEFFLSELATSTTSSGGGLPGAGAGTITGPTDGFCDWPPKGWTRIQTSAGALREIAYFSSRTDTILTVPALGRARLGTSAAAGAASDTIHSVPGIEIGFEDASPRANGSVQTIIDENTAPAAISFSTSISAGTGISVTDLQFQEQGALWVHRELPTGIPGIAKVLHHIRVDFSVDGTAYSERLSGLFRIAETALERFELHVGVGAEPDLSSAPDETFTSLPHTTILTLGTGTSNFLVTNFRNRYDLVSKFDQTTVITISGAGTQLTNAPSAPEVVLWEAAANGAFRVEGLYFYFQDLAAVQADQMLVFTRFDGTDPDPTIDTPTVINLTLADGAAFIDFTTATQADGTTGKVLLRTRRSADTSDSASSAIFTATADAVVPATPLGGMFFPGIAKED